MIGGLRALLSGSLGADGACPGRTFLDSPSYSPASAGAFGGKLGMHRFHWSNLQQATRLSVRWASISAPRHQRQFPRLFPFDTRLDGQLRKCVVPSSRTSSSRSSRAGRGPPGMAKIHQIPRATAIRRIPQLIRANSQGPTSTRCPCQRGIAQMLP